MPVQKLKTGLGRNPSGMTMLEVLIALVILAIGLLGMMSLQAASLRSNQRALYRTHATLAATEIAEKMRANRQGVTEGAYSPGNSSEELSADCEVLACAPAQLAHYELVSWNRYLSENLPAGRGIVCADSSPDDGSYDDPECDPASNPPTIMAIKVFWDDDGDGETELHHSQSVRF